MDLGSLTIVTSRFKVWIAYLFFEFIKSELHLYINLF